MLNIKNKIQEKLIITGNKKIFDRIYVINLLRRKDRLSFFKYKAKFIDHNIYLWQGIDACNSNEYQEIYTSYLNNLNGQKPLINSIGALGIIFTWINLLEHCIDKNYNKVCIFEDDVYFSKNFIFPEIKSDITYLGASQTKFSTKQLKLINNNKNYYLDDNVLTYGCYSVILNNKALKNLYTRLIKKVDKPLDIIINEVAIKSNLSSKIIYPYLVIPEVRDSDNMGKRSLEKMSKERNWNLSLYKDIEKYETFITNFDKNKPIEDKFFSIIIPSYNNQQWIYKNLTSVIKQNYYHWKIYYINDGSTDGTLDVLNNLIDQYDLKNKIKVINLEKNYGQAYARNLAYKQCDDEDILVMLDGDDWLYNDKVLSYLNSIYKNNDILLTYGKYIGWEDRYLNFATTKKFPQDIILNKSYRKYQWITHHLRTFKASILKTIPEWHLKDDSGNWLKCCTDVAESFWALENSNGKIYNVDETLYVYNVKNSKKYSNSYYNLHYKNERNQIYEMIKNR